MCFCLGQSPKVGKQNCPEQHGERHQPQEGQCGYRLGVQAIWSLYPTLYCLKENEASQKQQPNRDPQTGFLNLTEILRLHADSIGLAP